LDSKDGYGFTGKWIQVFDLNGAKQLMFLATNNKPSIPVQKLKPGVYLIRVGDGTEARVLKIVKQ
ncbi:MAG TPA: T9SS type A sorting domain-containing protein, partial [Ferruginibacter sp.]|nr:T9SS type A sorting domain-containing protein [Ferruginibacter sp.]